MGEFFGSMYCWFEDFFGLELANYLWGISSSTSTSNSFIGIGLSMFGVSLAVVLIFYYVLNHPKLNNWWGWSIFLVINAIVNFIIGYQWVKVCCNKAGELGIHDTQLCYFGVSNMLLSILVFFVFSFIVKWWSTNCSRAPFSHKIL